MAETFRPPESLPGSLHPSLTAFAGGFPPPSLPPPPPPSPPSPLSWPCVVLKQLVPCFLYIKRGLRTVDPWMPFESRHVCTAESDPRVSHHLSGFRRHQSSPGSAWTWLDPGLLHLHGPTMAHSSELASIQRPSLDTGAAQNPPTNKQYPGPQPGTATQPQPERTGEWMSVLFICVQTESSAPWGFP